MFAPAPSTAVLTPPPMVTCCPHPACLFLQVAPRGVVLFLHGFNQLPPDYDSLAKVLTAQGLCVVAPVLQRASAHDATRSWAALQVRYERC